jgi:hypothetical protein
MAEPEPTRAEEERTAVDAPESPAPPAPELAPAPTVVMAEPEPTQSEATGARPDATASPETESVVAANDVAPEPAIKPIIIGGAQDVVVEKKRGWWRR